MAHCLLTTGLLLCQNQLLSRVITDLLGLESNSPVTLFPFRMQVTVLHTPVQHGAVVTVPCSRAIGFHDVGLSCQTAAQAVCTSSVKVSLQSLCLPSGVWEGLGLAVLDQWERASTVPR